MHFETCRAGNLHDFVGLAFDLLWFEAGVSDLVHAQSVLWRTRVNRGRGPPVVQCSDLTKGGQATLVQQNLLTKKVCSQ